MLVLALLQYVSFHTANLLATVVQLLSKSAVSKYIRHGLLDIGMKNYGVEMAVLKHVSLNRSSPLELLTHQITSTKATREAVAQTSRSNTPKIKKVVYHPVQ